MAVVMAELEAQGPEASYVARPGDDREVEASEVAVEEAQEDLDGFLADTKLRGILGTDRYADAASAYVTVLNQAQADLEAARERHTGRFALLGHMYLQEWGNAERREWLNRLIRRCEVRKGREPLSERVALEL